MKCASNRDRMESIVLQPSLGITAISMERRNQQEKLMNASE